MMHINPPPQILCGNCLFKDLNDLLLWLTVFYYTLHLKSTSPKELQATGMKSLELRERLIKYLQIWEATVNSSNSFGLTNRNIGSEELYMHMLNIVHGHSLVKASAERVNFPAVDLIDRNRRLAVQITSDNSLPKIKKRIDIFNKHGLDREFEDFSFYIIGQRSKSIKEGDEYKGVPLDTNVIGTKEFITEVCSVDKTQEVCDFLEAELFSGHTVPESKRDITNNLFSGATIHPGVTVNVSTGSQTINVSPQSLSIDSHNQVLSIHDKGHPNNPRTGFEPKRQIENNATKYDQLQFILSEISNQRLCDIKPHEIHGLYDEIDQLGGDDLEELGNVLWLLLYFENSANKSPSLDLKHRAASKKSSLKYKILRTHKQILEYLELYQTQSVQLLNSIEYIDGSL